jgi:hypothetical protein
VRGSITDQLGSPLKDSRVNLRKYISQRNQSTVKTVNTDSDKLIWGRKDYTKQMLTPKWP